MEQSGKDKLLALLFSQGRELVNLKFFPGEKVSSAEEMLSGAHDILERALSGDGEGVLPPLKVEQRHFSTIV